MSFKEFLISCINDLPSWMYEMSISLFIIGVMLILLICKRESYIIWISRLLLLEYTFITIASTVLFRAENEDQKYDFHPFWSYQAIKEGNEILLCENIANILAFIPIGMAIAGSFKHRAWMYMFLLGITIPCGIEALQFYFRRGFSEFDDVFHNFIGGLIGYLICILLKKIICCSSN